MRDAQATLKRLARRYVWWKTPDDALEQPRRIVAQVMNIGTWDDAESMRRELGDEVLRDALAHADAGQFNARSWAWWHYRLDVAQPGALPPLPQRHLA